MIVTIALVAAATCMSPDFLARHPQAANVLVPAYLSEGPPAVREQRLRNSFAMMDRNADGFIAGAEIPLGTQGRVDHPAEKQASSAIWLDGIDRNNDGKADWQEFSGYFLPIMTVANCQGG